jgi:hypothetical protein
VKRIALLTPLLLGLMTTASAPAPMIQVGRADVTLNFPQEIVFHLEATSDRPLSQVEIEYGVEMSGCATSINRAVPDNFQPGSTVSTSWTWDMRQTGSLPPGSRIWWSWLLVDSTGQRLETDRQTLLWLDDVHPWQSLRAANLVLHWYTGTQAFAQQLLDSGTASVARLHQQLGDLPPGDVDVYIYDSSDAMRASILFEPAWSGGLAFPESRVVILGVGPGDLAWGLGAVAHELAHVVIGNLVNHCYSSLPTWLNEGLAVVAQGGPDPESQHLFDQALAANTLLPVRALSNGFAEDSGRASLSYAEAHSLVSFLLKSYGQPKMLDLLGLLQAGYRYDHALQQVYGFDSDGLDAAWRAALGAPPPAQTPLASQATPTTIATLVPLGGPPTAITSTPLPTVALSPGPSAARSGPSTWTWLLPWMCAAGIALLIIGLIVLLGVRRRRGGPGRPGHD